MICDFCLGGLGTREAKPEGRINMKFAYQAMCPHCEIVLDILTPCGRTPAPDWINFCRHCGGLAVFSTDGYSLMLRKATEEEFTQFIEIPGLRLMREEVIRAKGASHGAAS